MIRLKSSRLSLDQNDFIKSPILAGHLNKSQKHLWPGWQFKRTINGHFDHVTIINLFVSSRKMLSDYRIWSQGHT